MEQTTDSSTRSDIRLMKATHPEMKRKVAVVTGAAQGMGAVFARGLVRQGVNVMAGDINEEGSVSTAASINEDNVHDDSAGTVVGARIDVTCRDDHQTLLDSAVEQFGRVDYWVNNAGVFPFGDVLDITEAQMNTTYNVNVNGVLFGAQVAAQHMKDHGGGAIVNMASVAALRVRVGRAAYNSSKAAVKNLTNSLAVELGPHNIRVNAVAPGFVDTEMTKWVHEQPGKLEQVLSTVPLRRIGSPEEVYGAVLFLLSNSSRYITGNTLSVDGGSQHI